MLSSQCIMGYILQMPGIRARTVDDLYRRDESVYRPAVEIIGTAKVSFVKRRKWCCETDKIISEMDINEHELNKI